MNDDFLSDLWTEPEEDALDIDWNQLHRDGTAFRRVIRRRNLIEMFAAGAVVVFFARAAWLETDPWMRLCQLALVVGTLVVSWNLYRRGDAPEPEPATSTADFVHARRAELVYQAELLESVLGWYIGPLLPGVLGVLVVTGLSAGLMPTLPVALVIVATLWGIWWLNQRAARKWRS